MEPTLDILSVMQPHGHPGSHVLDHICHMNDDLQAKTLWEHGHDPIAIHRAGDMDKHGLIHAQSLHWCLFSMPLMNITNITEASALLTHATDREIAQGNTARDAGYPPAKIHDFLPQLATIPREPVHPKGWDDHSTHPWTWYAAMRLGLTVREPRIMLAWAARGCAHHGKQAARPKWSDRSDLTIPPASAYIMGGLMTLHHLCATEGMASLDRTSTKHSLDVLAMLHAKIAEQEKTNKDRHPIPFRHGPWSLVIWMHDERIGFGSSSPGHDKMIHLIDTAGFATRSYIIGGLSDSSDWMRYLQPSAPRYLDLRDHASKS
jgi:hypothetical protein